ncbi:hypothetical protein LWI28_019786 [Acer negundo]|uniref:Exocyst complex component SEC5 n=1 Tax=Acer negundo TaxID=4023 RepID=A0AAD5JX83_ACENE|nr:hypothetical protein LWI28_019786 [Acer negundo]KAK4839048.1 hypothetical protein QYF36_018620 [Acer negundo]
MTPAPSVYLSLMPDGEYLISLTYPLLSVCSSALFEAKLFLSRVHQDTSGADLESGALDIESKLKRIEDDLKGSGTSHLFNLMQGVNSRASCAFEPLLRDRLAQTEKIRSVQVILQRFRTLFNLPSTIRGSISKGEYDLAVREYKKAKSIGLPSHMTD